MPIQAIVFDFDGLILDTESPDVRAWQEIFDEHGQELPWEWWAYAIGRGVEQVHETPADILEQRLGRPVDREKLEEEALRRRLALIDSEQPLPGVVELIDEAIAGGIPLAIASSSYHDWVDPQLRRVGLWDRFSVVKCADDAPRAKPFPDLYLAATAALRVSPAEAVALEDSPNGVAAAKEAGLACVAVPNAMTKGFDLSRADRVEASLANITLADLLGLR